MKNLILIRHGKSCWDDPALADRDRPLNKRGKRDAPSMGRRLKDMKLKPDLILSSPAKRALKTAKLIAEEIGYPKKKIEIREELYAQGLEALASLVSGLDDKLERVYLVGHNPELTELANRLAGAEISNVPTCGVVAVDFPQKSWGESARKGGRLAFFDRPPKPSAEESPDENQPA